MPLSHEHIGSKIPAKIQIYTLTRAKLLFPLCYEIPCKRRYLYIAKPFKKCLTFKRLNGYENEVCDWIWEFREKEQNLFAKVEDVILDPDIQKWGESLEDSDDSDNSDDSNDK